MPYCPELFVTEPIITNAGWALGIRSPYVTLEGPQIIETNPLVETGHQLLAAAVEQHDSKTNALPSTFGMATSAVEGHIQKLLAYYRTNKIDVAYRRANQLGYIALPDYDPSAVLPPHAAAMRIRAIGSPNMNNLSPYLRKKTLAALALRAESNSNKEAARKAITNIDTLKGWIKEISQLFGAHNTAGMITFAMLQELLPKPESSEVAATYQGRAVGAMSLAALGCSNVQICHRLNIPYAREDTVKTILRTGNTALGLDTRTKYGPALIANGLLRVGAAVPHVKLKQA